jgi:hypothetical protein
VFIFSPALVLVVELLAFCDISIIKSHKTYLRPILPPGGRNWQLIYTQWQFDSLVLHGFQISFML